MTSKTPETPETPEPGDAQTRPPPRGWLTGGVVSIGASSLCSDAGHELTTSLLPTFLTAVLHSGPGSLGAIEGVSDALMGLSKLAGGALSADPPRRARLATSGYLLTGVATASIGLTTAVWQVAVCRGIAWVSRGVRSPARDSLLISLVPPEAYGRASGVERAGDNAGALAGPLLASALVAIVGVRHAILLSFVPGALAAVAITLAAHEARGLVRSPVARRRLSLSLRELRGAGLGRTLVPVGLFEMGNLATTLLILRATDLLHADTRSLTAATSLAVLLYVGHNAMATVVSLWSGRLSDRSGPRVALALGACCYVVGYLVFAWNQHAWPVLLAGFLLTGAGIGLAEPSETTLVSRSLSDELRASGFGLLGLVQAVGDLGATLVAGLLWAVFGATVAFAYAAAWMVASLLSTGPTGPPPSLRPPSGEPPSGEPPAGEPRKGTAA